MKVRGWKRLAPPVAVFVLHRALLAVIAWACGYSPFEPATYARWDSAFYLDIAARGYLPIHACPPESGYPPSDWCGNAGWFPGLPLALRLFGLAPEAGAIVLCAAAQLGALVLLWTQLDDERRWPALGLAGFFPGNVYFAAISPISVFLIAAVACLWATAAGRHALGAVAALVAALCHPTGILLAPVVLLWMALRRSWRPLIVAAGAVVGYVLVLWLMQREAGAWDAYFKVQAKYGYRIGPAVDALLRHLKPLVNARYRDPKGLISALQTLATVTLVVSVAVRARQHLAAPRESLVLLYLATFWAAPLALGGELALYRSEALLLPAVLLTPGLPRGLQLGLLAAFVALTIPMAALFFRGVLV